MATEGGPLYGASGMHGPAGVGFVITGRMAEGAPNFFFVDIQSSEVENFRNLVGKQAPEGKLVEVPMMRGRILALNGKDVAKIQVPPGGQWVLRGDRGITYSESIPENALLTEGNWWPKDYSGEPLVSFSSEEAKELGLKIGDTVTVNVLGRSLTAKIANLRKVDWESLSMNFVMVFSPNTFRGAPRRAPPGRPCARAVHGVHRRSSAC